MQPCKYCFCDTPPCTQLLGHTKMEIIVWWGEPTTGRVVWRYTGMDHGALSVTLYGLMMMLILSVDNYNTLKEPVCLKSSTEYNTCTLLCCSLNSK